LGDGDELCSNQAPVASATSQVADFPVPHSRDEKFAMRWFLAGFCYSILLIGIVGCAPPPFQVGRYQLESGVEVELFIEDDQDDVGDLLYYRVFQDGREVVPQTYLVNHKRNVPIQVQTGASADKSVVGLWSDTFELILYDLGSGESWPRLRDDEVSYHPTVQRKWSQRYRLLKESCELPHIAYFN
jgi:hypothetical protein